MTFSLFTITYYLPPTLMLAVFIAFAPMIKAQGRVGELFA